MGKINIETAQASLYSMNEIGVEIQLIGTEKLVAKFDGYIGALRPQLKIAMQKITFTLVRYVKERKLSGQVLNRRTGTLSRSIKGAVIDEPARIIGDVASRSGGNAPLKYAARWEYGFKGSEKVRQHIRRTATGGTANVRSFVRNINLNARPYLRPSKEENTGYIKETLQAAVKKVNQA